jgi:DNA-binding response OmpR family regulator
MKRVLIIDDDDAVRGALERVLARRGYAVRTAPGGEEGLAELRDEPVDVVVTDIIMPKMNGVDTIKAIVKEFPQVKIIAISGGGNFGITEYRPEAITTTAYLTAARQAGAQAVLTKPFETSELVAAIEAVSGGAGAPQ